jgi:hypothetical protein
MAVSQNPSPQAGPHSPHSSQALSQQSPFVAQISSHQQVPSLLEPPHSQGSHKSGLGSGQSLGQVHWSSVAVSQNPSPQPHMPHARHTLLQQSWLTTQVVSQKQFELAVPHSHGSHKSGLGSGQSKGQLQLSSSGPQSPLSQTEPHAKHSAHALAQQSPRS